MQKLYIGLLVYLALESEHDLKTRRISVNTACIFAVFALILHMWEGNWNIVAESIWNGVSAVLPGCLLLLMGKITREAIGYGDGILLLICGIYLGGRMAVTLCLTGLFCTFPLSLILLLSGKADRKTELPFAPFLLGAYLLWLMQI